MPERGIYADNIEDAVQVIARYLEDTSNTAHKAIYFEGWHGLAVSAVLRAIAHDPPPSLRKKFDKIIHVDCSRWKSRRALQRAIAEELKLPQRVMAIFDRQDEEDDFSGVDEGSREEMQDVRIEIFREIFRAILENRCFVVFHNGSNDTIDLSGLGLLGTTVLWTFRGRLRLNPKIKENVDNSHLCLYVYEDYMPDPDGLLRGEAMEVARHTHKPGITTEIATQCCLYLLSLNSENGDIMDYNWATHASSYWVCDGIIQQGQEDEAWEIGVALHQEIRLDDYSSNTLPSFGDEFQTPENRWVSEITYSDSQEGGQISVSTVHPETSSFFLAIRFRSEPDHPVASLPNNMFQQSEKLRVLKLCQCTFSFSSPPFHCCRSLRFLGLDRCKDQPQKQEGEEEVEKQDRPAMEIFQSLWVLDICYTDWELVLFPEITEQMATNIREVHIKKGRIWRSNLAWRRLRNLRKLRVFESTCPWETGDTDEFTDMGKLELLDLSRNNTMQVLPSLSGATGLKTLVLDGCVGLEHVGPEGLPPSLESFSLDAGAGGGRNEKAKISRISLAGCKRLVDLKLRGPLPNLEKLDLSGTAIKTLDLKNEVVRVPSLQQIILLGCEQLRSILWPEEGLPELTVLCIDSLVCRVQTEQHQTYATIMDLRFVQSLKSAERFCWNNDRFHLNLCGPSTSKEDGQRCNKEKMGRYSTGQVTGLPLRKSLIPKTCCSTYRDVADKMTTDHGNSSAPLFQLLDCHVEMGEGISNINVESLQGMKAIIFVMNKVKSLHVHDNSSLTSVIPERMMSTGKEKFHLSSLKRCRVERCPRLDTVFTTNYDIICFKEVETFYAANLPMARCIWSKGRTVAAMDTTSFSKLRSIHLHSCPRLTFVLPLSWFTLSSLETLYIVGCGDLRQVFPVEAEFLNRIATGHRKGTLQFPKLKHIQLHDLPSLQQICEAKMSAPMLETIRVRGCWGLRRLPAVGRDSRPTVDCEKDWWEKLEWDGEELESDGEELESDGEELEWDAKDVGHDLSLFNPRHSRYYKKALPRGSVLW